MPVEAKPIFRPDVIRLPILGFSLPESGRPAAAEAGEVGRDHRHRLGRRPQGTGDPRRFHQRRLLRAAGLHAGGRQPQALHDLAREARPGQRQICRRRPRRVWRRGESATSRPLRAKGRRTRSTVRSPAGRSRRSTRRSTTPSTSAATGSSSRTSARPGSITRARTSRPTSGSTPRPWPQDEQQLRKFVFLLHASRMVPLHGPCHLDALFQESEKVGRESDQGVVRALRLHPAEHALALRRGEPRRRAPVDPGLLAEAARPDPLHRLLRGSRPAARRDDQAGVLPPRPVQPAPALGQLPRDVPGGQRRQR